MATQYTSQVVKQNGPQYIIDNVTTAFVCIAPLKTDSVAQISAKAIGQVAYAGVDISLSGAAPGDADLQVIFNGKNNIDPSGTADDGGDGDGPLGDDLVVVFCSGSENLAALDIVDRNITNETGDTISFGQGTYTVNELVAV